MIVTSGIPNKRGNLSFEEQLLIAMTEPLEESEDNE